jgi:hypothetical protein
MNRRPPRKFTTTPAPTANHGNTADKGAPASLLPLPPPTWVQSITRSLECQGASQGLAGAITRYFAAIELEAMPVPRLIVRPHGRIEVEFVTTGPFCRFRFWGRYAVVVEFMTACGTVTEDLPIRLESLDAIALGRSVLEQLDRSMFGRRKHVPLPGDFELPGDRDALPVNRPVKAGKAKDGRRGR